MPSIFRASINDILLDKVLTGREEISPPKFAKIEQQDERLDIIEKGLLLLTKLTTDWEIQAIEWKKILEIIIYGIPDKVKGIKIKSKETLVKIKNYITVRPRGRTWSLIQIGVHELSNELPVCRKIGCDLIKAIFKTLKSKPLDNVVKNGINWQVAMNEKPKNFHF